MNLPEKLRTPDVLKFKSKQYVKKLSNQYYVILIVNFATGAWIGFGHHEYLWLIGLGILLTLSCFLYAFENLSTAITANLVSAVIVIATFYDAWGTDGRWKLFCIAAAYQCCFLGLMLVIYLHKCLSDQPQSNGTVYQRDT